MRTELPLFVRISATDWAPGGWTIEDSIVLARHLAEKDSKYKLPNPRARAWPDKGSAIAALSPCQEYLQPGTVSDYLSTTESFSVLPAVAMARQ